MLDWSLKKAFCFHGQIYNLMICYQLCEEINLLQLTFKPFYHWAVGRGPGLSLGEGRGGVVGRFIPERGEVRVANIARADFLLLFSE